MLERTKAMHGTIEVESTLNRGTMITVEVPCEQKVTDPQK
jgi:chemotaxis protein histidine kinase CheA